MESFLDILKGKTLIIIAALSLAVSLYLLLNGYEDYFDPAILTVFICGLPIALAAVRALFVRKKITSALLITIAMIAAICIGELFAAAEIAFIMTIGELLEDMTIKKAKKGINK